MGKTKVFRGFFVFLRRKSPNGDGKQVADRSKGACIYLVATESWTYDDALRALWKRQKLAPRTMTVFRAIGALVQGGLKVYPPLRGWFFFFARSLAKLGLVLPTEANNYEFDESLVWLAFAGRDFPRLEIVTAKCVCVIFFSFPLSNQVL